jgi:amidase
MELPFRSAKQLAAAVRRRALGAEELLDLYLARVKRHNPRLNAIVVTCEEAARKRARAADAAVRRGHRAGPLHGVPITVKEAYDVTGLPTTWGEPRLKSNIARRHALAVQRLEDAGAVIFGKTNVPWMLADWQTYNDVYGATNNPWDVTRVPGGSSGGSAAALAAGLTGLEAGSDIGSSIRNPAHYCGVYGHKPTWGVIPTLGHALPGVVSEPDIAVVGPLARSAEDLALALDVMAGPDGFDGTGWALKLPPPRHRRLREFRVAIKFDDPVCEVDRDVRARLEALADFLRRRRVRVAEAQPDFDSDEAFAVYLSLLGAATSGGLSEEEVRRRQELARALAPGDESLSARLTRSTVLRHGEWLAADNRRHQLRAKWAEFFREHDLLLCPVASSAAFPHNPHGQRLGRMIEVNGKPMPYLNQLFWAGYTGAFYLPASAAPIGFTPAGLPVGVQIAGPQYGDRTCIHFARLLEREYHGFVPPPGYT